MNSIINVKETIKDINDCLKCKNVRAALELALSLPDVCGSLEWPELEGTGHVGERYKKWYNEYVLYFISPLSFYKNDIEQNFSADECYQLRCSLMHSCDTNIKDYMMVDYYYIDLKSNIRAGRLIDRGNKLELENGDWKLKKYFYIVGAEIIGCILDGANVFIKRYENLEI